MFPYVDPVGRSFLGSPAVELVYRTRMQAVYEGFARRRNSAFTWIEAFDSLSGGQSPQTAEVDWFAFPLLATGSDSDIDQQRLRFQDEYVEWRAESSGAGLTRVTFTTEFPEYYQAFAEVGASFLVDAIKDAIPGANPTNDELFGPGVNPDGLPALARANLFRSHLPQNPWNNGQKGILCLMQQFNTLGALFNLAAECSVRLFQGTPQTACGLVGGACGPGRSSDPNICAEAQTAVRNGVALSLHDPAGIRIVRLAGDWALNGQSIDINNPTDNQGTWTVTRNGRRGVLSPRPGLTLDGNPLVTGTQVSRKLLVTSSLLTAPEPSLPDWARLGTESTSRGPS